MSGELVAAASIDEAAGARQWRRSNTTNGIMGRLKAGGRSHCGVWTQRDERQGGSMETCQTAGAEGRSLTAAVELQVAAESAGAGRHCSYVLKTPGIRVKKW